MSILRIWISLVAINVGENWNKEPLLPIAIDWYLVLVHFNQYLVHSKAPYCMSVYRTPFFVCHLTDGSLKPQLYAFVLLSLVPFKKPSSMFVGKDKLLAVSVIDLIFDHRKQKTKYWYKMKVSFFNTVLLIKSPVNFILYLQEI